MAFPPSSWPLSGDVCGEGEHVLEGDIPSGHEVNASSAALRNPSHKVSSRRSEALAAGGE